MCVVLSVVLSLTLRFDFAHLLPTFSTLNDTLSMHDSMTFWTISNFAPKLQSSLQREKRAGLFLVKFEVRYLH